MLKMRSICLSLTFLIINGLYGPVSGQSGRVYPTQIPASFTRLPLDQVKPAGWMKAQLERDLESGFTGHLDELTHWARADIFSEERILGYSLTGEGEREHIPKSWWPGETNPVWMDGYLQSAFLSGDPTSIEKSSVYVRSILDSRTSEAYMGIYLPEARYNHSCENAELWAQSRVFRVLLAYYEFTGEEEVLRAVEKTVDLTMEHYDGSSTYFGVDNGLGGVSHGLMFLDVLEWLYRLTGNYDYVDYGVQLYKDYSLFENPRLNDSRLDFLLDPDRPIVGHTPHAAEHLRVPAWLFNATGDSIYLQAYELGYQKLKKYMVPSGAVHSGDREDVEGLLPEPHMPYEYCGITELFDTQTSLLAKTGRNSYADEAELLFLNAGQGARLSNGKGVNYFSRDNKFKATPEGSGGRFKFSPTHEDVAVCCNPNAAKLMPYYIRNMYMRGQADQPILACMLFGPSVVNAQVGGTKVRVEQSTGFPFSDTLVLYIDPEKKVSFELRIRIPHWAGEMEISAGNAGLRKENGFYVISKKWKKGDRIRLVFRPEIQEVKTVNGETALRRGPLLYALPLPHQCEEIKSYPMEGFADLSCIPADSSLWELEMPGEGGSDNFTFEAKSGKDPLHPWDDPPLKLTGTLLNRAGEQVPVDLLPMGATVLRRVSFPAAFHP